MSIYEPKDFSFFFFMNGWVKGFESNNLWLIELLVSNIFYLFPIKIVSHDVWFINSVTCFGNLLIYSFNLISPVINFLQWYDVREIWCLDCSQKFWLITSGLKIVWYIMVNNSSRLLFGWILLFSRSLSSPIIIATISDDMIRKLIRHVRARTHTHLCKGIHKCIDFRFIWAHLVRVHNFEVYIKCMLIVLKIIFKSLASFNNLCAGSVIIFKVLLFFAVQSILHFEHVGGPCWVETEIHLQIMVMM